MLLSHNQSQAHELKFRFPSYRRAAILQWLHHLCQPDPQFPRHRIATIYYDTLDRQLIGEKQNSDYRKTKVRVRWYNPVDQPETSDGTWLEIKQKTGAQRHKRRFRLPYSQAMLASLPLEHPLVCVEIPQQLPIHGIAVTTALRPMFLLQYERYRFIEPVQRVRVCVDNHLSVLKVNRQLFPVRPLAPNPVVVLEIKGAVTGLPPALRPLLNLGCVKTSFSKYGACYRELLREGG